MHFTRHNFFYRETSIDSSIHSDYPGRGKKIPIIDTSNGRFDIHA
jgi:hypothetical protein